MTMHPRIDDARNRANRTWTLLSTAAFAAAMAVGCSSDTPSTPTSGGRVTMAVGGESFRVALTTADQVAAARAAQSGGPARIPIGRIVAGTQVNSGWSWHLEDVTFVEVAIELCDGRASDVERAGIQFGGGRFCPWSAAVVRIE